MSSVCLIHYISKPKARFTLNTHESCKAPVTVSPELCRTGKRSESCNVERDIIPFFGPSKMTAT